MSAMGGKLTLRRYPVRQKKRGSVAVTYLRAAKARPDLTVPFVFFLAFLIYKLVTGELGGLAVMSAYFVGFFNAKLASLTKAADAN